MGQFNNIRDTHCVLTSEGKCFIYRETLENVKFVADAQGN